MLNKIIVGKKYRTRNNFIVKIDTNYSHFVDELYPYGGVYIGYVGDKDCNISHIGDEDHWSKTGRVALGQNSPFDIIEEYKEVKYMYPESYTRDTALALNAEKRFLSVDKETGTTQAYTTIEEAKTDCTRKLREGKEFLIVELVCSVRPKPIDAEIEEY